LLGLRAFPSLDAQRARFAAAGFARRDALDMESVYYDVLAPELVRRCGHRTTSTSSDKQRGLTGLVQHGAAGDL
jgi:hypothetical protein